MSIKKLPLDTVSILFSQGFSSFNSGFPICLYQMARLGVSLKWDIHGSFMG